jgi:hypothetical protein
MTTNQKVRGSIPFGRITITPLNLPRFFKKRHFRGVFYFFPFGAS